MQGARREDSAGALDPDSEFGDPTLLQVKTASCLTADERGFLFFRVHPRLSAAKSLPMF